MTLDVPMQKSARFNHHILKQFYRYIEIWFDFDYNFNTSIYSIWIYAGQK